MERGTKLESPKNRAALDVTESALLRPCFPGVKYLRIDGSVAQAERAAAVDRFSADASVAVLLLTTRVGHLGLNLSAASMVVFLEHDWNPQVDLQVRLVRVCRVDRHGGSHVLACHVAVSRLPRAVGSPARRPCVLAFE